MQMSDPDFVEHERRLREEELRGAHLRLKGRAVVSYFFIALVGFLVLLLTVLLPDVFEKSVSRAPTIIFGTILLFTSTAAILLKYLQGLPVLPQQRGREVDKRIQITDAKVRFLERRIAKMAKENTDNINELATKVARERVSQEFLSDTERQNLVNLAFERVQSEATEGILEELRSQIADRDRDSQLSIVFQSAVQRLATEIAALSRRSNLNLVIGIIWTAVGLGVLTFVVFSTIDLPRDLATLLTYYVPRISLVIFIEIFAYFFLKLYKQNLSEIKYFQNELTNIEAWYTSLQMALADDDPTVRGKITQTLAETERNFVLEKGQSTVDLERLRADRESLASLAGLFEKATQNFRK